MAAQRGVWKRRFQSAGAVIFAALFLFPLYWMLITSVKTSDEIFALRPTLWPRQWTWEGYRSQLTARESVSILRYFYNSTVISVWTTIVSLFFGVTSGYGLARFRFRVGRAVLFIFLIAQMLPAVMFLVPLFQTFTALGLIDTYTAVVINVALFTVPFSVLILRPYFLSVPKEFEDSARIDGCGRVGTFVRIVAPVASPGIIVAGALSFLLAWGNLIGPLTFLRTETMYPLTVNMYRALGRYGARWGELMAYAAIVTLPVVALFVALQRYLVAGLTAGSVKG
ncbi:MAG: carbohydrate ABC transporter permease [Spirochaetales bacterium]|nr:carbohydrate ABC transporter permease [Spirochaetales bacterium]